jgi:Cohesin domain/PEP-CTERM motif
MPRPAIIARLRPTRTLGVAVAALTLVGWSSPAAAAPIPISLVAGSDTVEVGETFTVAISVSDALGLTSFQFDIGFDPTIIALVSFSDTGTDFDAAATNGGGFLTGLTGFPQGTPTNYLSGVADSIVLGPGLTPNGTVLTLTFQALAVGVSPLTFSCALCQGALLVDDLSFLSSANGDVTLLDGLVTVTSPDVPVPEPGTLALLLGGLTFVARHRRRPRWRRHS